MILSDERTMMNKLVGESIGLAKAYCVAMRLAFSIFLMVSTFASAFAAESMSIAISPRYPWNGKVDLKFTIGADETEGGYAAHQPGDDAIAGYRLKYVQSAGDAQLNTGVVPGSKNTIELKFAFDGTPASQNQCLYCARGATTATASYTCFLLEGRWRFDYNSASGTESTTPTPVSGVPMVIRTVAGSASVDGVAVQSYTAANFTVGGQLALFSSYVEAPGTRSANYLKGKIYYLKIFGDDGTTLLHDFVPWEKDGVVGMYDTIAARFVAPNVGTLTCGIRGPKYDTSFTAKDVTGGTNLTMKTLYKSNGTAANVGKEALLPGTYNWVWDAEEDLTRRWVTYSGCVPTNSAVLFANVQLSELSEFYAVPCGKAVSDKSNLAKGAYIKDDGAGKSVQFAFSDDVFTKCVCVHLEQSGPNVVGYAKWARYVTGTGYEKSDFDITSTKTMTVAISETEAGYGLLKLEAKGVKLDSAPVLERVVAEGNIEVSAFLYTVKFNANGGTGTMVDEPLAYGIEKALTANAFKRTGYTFQGWATSATGAKVYSDKQSVSNLTTTAGATVNLYAVWKNANPLYMVIDLSGGSSATSYPVTYLDAVPSGGWTDTYKTTKLVLRRCDAGSFIMGSDQTDTSHKVTLTKAFYIGVFEMTQKQWSLVTGDAVGYGYILRDVPVSPDTLPKLCTYASARGSTNGAKWPSSSVVDASSFLGKLRVRTKKNVDLPTEAQWEYACRAGTTSTYYWGNAFDGAYCWYANNSPMPAISRERATVGKKKANAWGLYDMIGNAFEGCLDWHGTSSYGTDPKGPTSGTKRVKRGGGWYSETTAQLTSSARLSVSPSENGPGDDPTIGFRLCLTVE